MHINSDFSVDHNIREYEVFLQVFHSGSLTKSAAYLEISQSNAKVLIKNLETKLRKKLFKKERGILRPTLEAIRLYENLKPVFRAFDFIRAKTWMDEPAMLRITTLPSFSGQYLLQLVASFARQNSNIRVSLDVKSDLIAQKEILSGDIDLVLRYANTTVDPDLVHLPFIRSRSICLVPRDHKLADFDVLTPELLSGEPQVTRCHRFSVRTEMNRAFARAGSILNSKLEFSTNHLAAEMVRLGAGLAIINSFPITQYLSEDILVKRFEPSFTRYTVITHHRHQPLSPIAEKFVEFLRQNVIESSHTELTNDKFKINSDHQHY